MKESDAIIYEGRRYAATVAKESENCCLHCAFIEKRNHKCFGLCNFFETEKKRIYFKEVKE